jgi:hypothetical protein
MKPEVWQRHQLFELRCLLDVVNRAPSESGVDPPPHGCPEHALLRALAEEERQRHEAWKRAVNEDRQAACERMAQESRDAYARGDQKAIRRILAEERRRERRIAAEERGGDDRG